MGAGFCAKASPKRRPLGSSWPRQKEDILRSIKRSHFAGGDLTPPLTKGDARPLWKPHNFVPASRGGVNIESISPPPAVSQSPVAGVAKSHGWRHHVDGG